MDNILPVIAPDSVQYAKIRYDEIKQSNTYRLLSVSKEVGGQVFAQAKENVLGDYGTRDILIRAASTLNPLLGALVPQQEDIKRGLQTLRDALEIQNPYLEQQTRLEEEQLNALQELKEVQKQSNNKLDNIEVLLGKPNKEIKHDNIPDLTAKPIIKSTKDEELEELKNIQIITAKKLDELEETIERDKYSTRGRESTNIQPVKAQSKPETQYDNQVIEAKISDQKQPLKVELVDANSSKTQEPRNKDVPEDIQVIADNTIATQKYAKELLEEIKLIRALQERTTSFLTGSEQFGLSGFIDRLFNKYTVLLDKHPALRGLQTVVSTIAKIKLGLTKPAGIKETFGGVIRRLLGVSSEEGPLQQLVTIASAQTDIQYKIYEIIKEHFKKFDERFDLSDDTKQYLQGIEPDAIDKFLDKAEEKILNLSPVKKVLELKQSLKEKSEEKQKELLENIKQKITKSSDNKQTDSSIVSGVGVHGLNAAFISIPAPSISNVYSAIKERIQPVKDKAIIRTANVINTSRVKDVLANSKITQKIQPVYALAKKPAKAVVQGFEAIDVLQNKFENVVGGTLEKTLNKASIIVPERIKKHETIQRVAQKRQQLANKLASDRGQFVVGLSSFVNPLAPALIHVSAGNYKLAARESLYAVPIVGQVLAAKSMYDMYKQFKQSNQNATFKDFIKSNISDAKETVKEIKQQIRLPKVFDKERSKEIIEQVKEVNKLKQQQPVLSNASNLRQKVEPKTILDKIKNLKQQTPSEPLLDNIKNLNAAAISTNLFDIQNVNKVIYDKETKQNLEKYQTLYKHNIIDKRTALGKKYDELREKSLIVNLITRLPIVKFVEGVLRKDVSKAVWGAFGTFMPMVYYPIEGIKFLGNVLAKKIPVIDKLVKTSTEVLKVITKTATKSFMLAISSFKHVVYSIADYVKFGIKSTTKVIGSVLKSTLLSKEFSKILSKTISASMKTVFLPLTQLWKISTHTYKLIKDPKKYISNLKENMKDLFKPVISIGKDIVSIGKNVITINKNLVANLTKTIFSISKDFADINKRLVDRVGTFTKHVVASVKEIGKISKESLFYIADQLGFGKYLTAIAKKLDSVKESISNRLDILNKKFSNYYKLFASWIKWQKMKQMLSAVFSAVKNTIGGIVSTVGDIAGGLLGGKIFGKLGGAASKVASAGVAAKGAGLLGRIAGSGGGLLSKVGAIGRFAGPIGLALTGATALYGGFKGWNQANEIFNTDNATLGQKLSAGLGGALSTLSFGLLDKESISKGIYNIGSKAKEGLKTIIKLSPIGFLANKIFGSNEELKQKKEELLEHKVRTAKIADNIVHSKQQKTNIATPLLTNLETSKYKDAILYTISNNKSILGSISDIITDNKYLKYILKDSRVASTSSKVLLGLPNNSGVLKFTRTDNGLVLIDARVSRAALSLYLQEVIKKSKQESTAKEVLDKSKLTTEVKEEVTKSKILDKKLSQPNIEPVKKAINESTEKQAKVLKDATNNIANVVSNTLSSNNVVNVNNKTGTDDSVNVLRSKPGYIKF